MDKGKIQIFSDNVREKLLKETRNRAAYFSIMPDKILEVEKEYGDSIVIGGRVHPISVKKQRAALAKKVRENGYEQTIDEITYTWFNRFMAIRFMEVNGYIPVKVFSSNEKGKTEPDIISNATKLEFLKIDKNRVLSLKSEGKDEELYKYLILEMCHYLHETMPFLFGDIENYTELLFPDRMLHTDSIVRDMADIIPEEDWKEVEIIGWMYQDYINPRKKDVYAKLKKNVKVAKEDIPAVTQLFTPKWIVRYMVENSLGRLWLESNPNKELQTKWKYFIQQDFTSPKTKTHNPEEITVMDPAMGSGHILVYAFEVLYDIYHSRGYSDKDIATTILAKNLYGLEIDERATQLAGFALMMKARAYDKDLFRKGVNLNLCTIRETKERNVLDPIKYPEANRLWNFYVDAQIYGSALKISEHNTAAWKRELEKMSGEKELKYFDYRERLAELIVQTEYLNMKYDCVVTNPPYMGSKAMNDKLRDFVKNNYPMTKSDMFAVFIERCLDFKKSTGYTAMITMQSWMFLSSYEKLRKHILENYQIDTMVHLGPHAFEQIGGEVVSTTAFVLRN